MKFLADALGGGVLKQVHEIIDDLHTSDDEKAAAMLKLRQIELEPQLAQIAVNREAAKSAHWYVAAGRPTVIWLCMAVMAMWSVSALWPGLLGVDRWGLELVKDALLFIVSPLLGVSAMRTSEKFRGVARNNFKE